MWKDDHNFLYGLPATFISPCFRCKVRHDGCHAKCVNYNIYVNRKKEFKEKVRLEEIKMTQHEDHYHWRKRVK